MTTANWPCITRAVNMNALGGMAAQDLEEGTVRGRLCLTGKGAGTPRGRVVSGWPVGSLRRRETFQLVVLFGASLPENLHEPQELELVDARHDPN